MKNLKRYLTAGCLVFIFWLTGCGQKEYGTTPIASTVSKESDAEAVDVSITQDASAEDNRTMVTLSIFRVTPEIETAVVAFNQSNSVYYVEIISGEEGSSASDFWEREMIEISAGKGPDLFSKTQQATFNTYVEKGVMEDLTPYIERDLNKEDYLESSLYAYAKDGKVYAIEAGFTLSLLVGSEEILGDRKGWNLTEMKKIMDAQPQLTVFQNYYSGAGAFLNNYLAYGNSSYTDYETLRACIAFDKAYETRLSSDVPAIPGQTVLVESINLSDALSWADYEALYGQSLTPIGYVNTEGEGILHSSFGWSINAASKQKEGAWAFLRFLLSEEYQREYVHEFSPLKKILEEQLAYYAQPITDTYYDKELGRDVTFTTGHILKRTTDATEVTSAYVAEHGTTCVTIDHMSSEQLDTVRQLIDRSHVISFSWDNTAHKIIFEEATYYFNGKRSLDEVMKNIENRMELYMAEKE